MNAVRARHYEDRATSHETAFVSNVRPLRLKASGIEYEAARAVSCLVAPRLGDEVYVALQAEDRLEPLHVRPREEAVAAPGAAGSE